MMLKLISILGYTLVLMDGKWGRRGGESIEGDGSRGGVEEWVYIGMVCYTVT